MISLIEHLNFGILIYFLALSIWYAFTLILSYPDILRNFKLSDLQRDIKLMQYSSIPITILMPAFNQSKEILASIESVFKQNYPHLKLIIINDGSTDKTLNLLTQHYQLYSIPPAFRQSLKTQEIHRYYRSATHPSMLVIDKAPSLHHNAADALNAALNACQTPLCITLDADTVLSSQAVETMLFEFLSEKHCITVGGTVHILNDNQVKQGQVISSRMPKRWIPGFQFLEYFRAFTYGRAGLNALDGALCFPGAFTMYETRALKEFGGFDVANYAYDTDIIMQFHQRLRQHHYPTRVHFSAKASAWTKVPATLKSYWIQRNHWQRGMLRSIVRHRGMLFNPRYGVVGLLTFPSYVLFETLGPCVEFMAYVVFGLSLYLGLIHAHHALWFLLLAWAYLTLLSTGTYVLSVLSSGQNFGPWALARQWILLTAEWFGFRQFRASCCFISTCQFIVNRCLGRAL